MNSDIETYVGIGPLKLGMTHEQVAQAMGGETPDTYVKHEGNPPVDYFTSFGMMVEYQRDTAAFFEFNDAPKMSPTYNGFSFLGKPYKQAEKFIRKHDPNVLIDYSRYFSMKLGIALFIEHRRIECVSVFRQGYYDGVLP